MQPDCTWRDGLWKTPCFTPDPQPCPNKAPSGVGRSGRNQETFGTVSDHVSRSRACCESSISLPPGYHTASTHCRCVHLTLLEHPQTFSNEGLYLMFSFSQKRFVCEEQIFELSDGHQNTFVLRWTAKLALRANLVCKLKSPWTRFLTRRRSSHLTGESGFVEFSPYPSSKFRTRNEEKIRKTWRCLSRR